MRPQFSTISGMRVSNNIINAFDLIRQGAAQVRTFYYKVVRNTKSCTKVQGVVIERSSEYKVREVNGNLYVNQKII